jgi:hypothetical protein
MLDIDLQCYNENEDYEEATVEQIAVKRQNISEDQYTNGYGMAERVQVSNQNSRKFSPSLLLYLMQEGSGGSPISAPESCADFVQLQSIKRTQQDTLDQFLQRH